MTHTDHVFLLFESCVLVRTCRSAGEKYVRLLDTRGVLSGPCIVRMVAMRDVHLRNLDLNLIHPLHALLEECHVARAAKRSFLSQSAMSRALERLREMFGDP